MDLISWRSEPTSCPPVHDFWIDAQLLFAGDVARPLGLHRGVKYLLRPTKGFNAIFVFVTQPF